MWGKSYKSLNVFPCFHKGARAYHLIYLRLVICLPLCRNHLCSSCRHFQDLTFLKDTIRPKRITNCGDFLIQELEQLPFLSLLPLIWHFRHGNLFPQLVCSEHKVESPPPPFSGTLFLPSGTLHGGLPPPPQTFLKIILSQ